MPYRVASRPRRRAFYLLLVAGAAAGIVALSLTLASRLNSTHAQVGSACVQVHRLERVIVAVLHQSLATLGTPNSPGYAYYQAHPAELAATRLSLQHEIALFTNQRC